MHSHQNKNKINEKLKISSFKLESLLDITKAINNNVPKEKLFKLYSDILKSQLRIGKVLFLINNGKSWDVAVRYGWRSKTYSFNIETDLLDIKDIKTVTSNKLFYPFDIVVPVFHKNIPIAYVLIGDFDEDYLEISPTIKHLPFIQTLTNIVSVAIENKRLAKEHVKKLALDKELDLAREVQEMLFPRTLNLSPLIQASAKYIPHNQIGGDYYDFFKIDEQRYAFCIADVSGKGVSAALLMSNFQANLHALIKQSFSLSDLARGLNKKVTQASRGERFITFFIGIYNSGTRILNYINAGHLAPVLFSKGKFIYLKEGSTGLGMVDELPFLFEGKISIENDDLLFMYTDGVAEIKGKNGYLLSNNEIENFIKRNYQKSVDSICKLFFQFLFRNSERKIPSDDLTMFIVRFL